MSCENGRHAASQLSRSIWGNSPASCIHNQRLQSTNVRSIRDLNHIADRRGEYKKLAPRDRLHSECRSLAPTRLSPRLSPIRRWENYLSCPPSARLYLELFVSMTYQRKYVDLIRQVSSKWANWDPPIPVKVHLSGTPALSDLIFTRSAHTAT